MLESRDREQRSRPRAYLREAGAQAEGELLDSIDDVTRGKTAFKGVAAETRAMRLPDNQFESYFLSVFGRPDASSASNRKPSTHALSASAYETNRS